MGALMYQILMKPGAVLLSRFGFKSRVFRIFVRSVLKACKSLIKTVLRNLVFFQAKGKQPIDLSK